MADYLFFGLGLISVSAMIIILSKFYILLKKDYELRKRQMCEMRQKLIAGDMSKVCCLCLSEEDKPKGEEI